MTHPMPSRALYFIDISDNNPIPDLDAYKAAGHVWLARKVSEGVGYHWSAGDTIADQWHQLGGHVVHYHWLRPDSNVEAQLAYYLGLLAPHWADGDKTMNDWERSTVYSTGQPATEPPDLEWAARAALFNDGCQREHGAHCLYTGNWYIDGHPHMQAEARRWPVILSDYSGGDTTPNNRFGLNLWARQFTDRATVPGMSATVDYNHILNPALGGTVSANGPEHWDAADFAKLAAALTPAMEVGAQKALGYWSGHDKLPTWASKFRARLHIPTTPQGGQK